VIHRDRFCSKSAAAAMASLAVSVFLTTTKILLNHLPPAVPLAVQSRSQEGVSRHHRVA
jgi:hypothetical protein